jgi:hypothetical protein
VWTPDGHNLIIAANAGPTLAWRDANGSGPAYDLLPGINMPGPFDFHSGRIRAAHELRCGLPICCPS